MKDLYLGNLAKLDPNDDEADYPEYVKPNYP